MSAVTSARDPATWQRRAVALVAAWAVVALGLALLGQAITGPLETTMEPAESDLARAVVDLRSGTLSDVAQGISLLGDTITVLVLVPLIAAAVWFWRRDVRPVLLVVVTSAGATAMYLAATVSTDRERPPVRILDPGLDPLHSYPSGHVAAATALYGVLVVLAWAYAGRRVRWWTTALLVLPVLVAVSRMYEGAHHLSDVLSSMLFGAAWVLVAAVALLGERGPLVRDAEPSAGRAT